MTSFNDDVTPAFSNRPDVLSISGLISPSLIITPPGLAFTETSAASRRHSLANTPNSYASSQATTPSGFVSSVTSPSQHPHHSTLTLVTTDGLLSPSDGGILRNFDACSYDVTAQNCHAGARGESLRYDQCDCIVNAAMPSRRHFIGKGIPRSTAMDDIGELGREDGAKANFAYEKVPEGGLYWTAVEKMQRLQVDERDAVCRDTCTKETHSNYDFESNFQDADNHRRRLASNYLETSSHTPLNPQTVKNVNRPSVSVLSSTGIHSNDVTAARPGTSLANRKSTHSSDVTDASPLPVTSRSGRRFTRANDVMGGGAGVERKQAASKPRAEKSATRRERKATKTLAIVLGK